MQSMTFKDFDFNDKLSEGLDAMGFEKPTPIQEQAIPAIMQGRDLIGCAQTGTGKTAAFLLPTLHHLGIRENPEQSIGALIIVPTRELAQQIDMQLEGFSYFTELSSIAIYGGGKGSDFEQEKRALTSGADVIVATPGRLMSHLNLGYVKVDGLQTLILDEADRMLDMGFYEDIMRITRQLPKKRQTLMFSATMPKNIRKLAHNILQDPVEVNIAISKPAEGVDQQAYLTNDDQKIPVLANILSDDSLKSTIIFASTKRNVKEITKQLRKQKFDVEEIHSDLEQAERKETLRKFKNRKISMLVATDVISRGIDIEDLSMVVNYNVPDDPEDYVHRVGRTARAERQGRAVTFINRPDQRKFQRIENMIGDEIKKNHPPEEIGKGPEYSPGKGGGGRRNRKGKKRFSKGKGNNHRGRPGGNGQSRKGGGRSKEGKG